MDLTTYLRSPSWDTYPVWATWVESPGLTPLVAVQIGLDGQEDGHRFTVHSHASGGPEILSSVAADAGSLGFSVGAGMEFWVTRDADGASSLAGGVAWVADPSQTTTGSDQIAVFYGSANGVFPDPPERGYALEPQTFRVHWQRAAHAFTVWMSDGYRTAVAAEAISWQQLATSADGSALWNPLDVFTFTVPTDPTRAWWLRDDTTGEVFPAGQTDVLDGWKPLAAEPEWLPAITLRLPGWRSGAFRLRQGAWPAEASGEGSTGSMLSTAAGEWGQKTLPGADAMVAYTIDTVSVSLSSPNPNDGIFQVADAIGGLWWGTIYWGENDLLAWLPPVENCYLTISSSRFGHELLLRHPNGEAYPVLKGQTKGSLWFAPNGLGWQVSYYYFGATASCRPMLPWYVEDASNGERIGPNPTNAQLINWTAIAAPQNLAATEQADGTFLLTWTFGEDSLAAAFRLERRESAGEPWQIIDTFPAADTLDPVEHTAYARTALAASQPGKTASIRVFYEYGSQRSAPSNIVNLKNDDTDNDGMPDWWEMKYFGDLDKTVGDDFDGDGVLNAAEHAQGTDPNNADDFDPNPITISVALHPVVLDVENSVEDPDRTHIQLRWNTPGRTDILHTKLQRKAGLNTPWQTLGIIAAGGTSHEQQGLFACLKYSYRLLFTLPDHKAGVSNVAAYEVPLIRALIVQSADSNLRFPGFLQLNSSVGPSQKYLGYKIQEATHADGVTMSDDTTTVTLTPGTRTMSATSTFRYDDPIWDEVYSVVDQAPSPATAAGTQSYTAHSSGSHGTLNIGFGIHALPGGPYQPWSVSGPGLWRADPDSLDWPRNLILGPWSGTFHYFWNNGVSHCVTTWSSEGLWSGSLTTAGTSESSTDHSLYYRIWSGGFDSDGRASLLPNVSLPPSGSSATWSDMYVDIFGTVHEHNMTWTLSLPYATDDLIKLAVSNLQPHPANFMAPYLCDASRWGTWGGSRTKLVYDPSDGGNEPWEPEGVDLLKGFVETKVSQFRLSANQTVVDIKRSQYKFTVNPVAPHPDIPPILSFKEIFVPTNAEGTLINNPAAFQTREQRWTAKAGDTESPVFTSDPIANSDHPESTPLGYSVLGGLLPVEIESVYEKDQVWNKAPNPRQPAYHAITEDKEPAKQHYQRLYVAIEPESGEAEVVVKLNSRPPDVESGKLLVCVTDAGTIIDKFGPFDADGKAILTFAPTGNVNDKTYTVRLGCDINKNNKLSSDELLPLPSGPDTYPFTIKVVRNEDYTQWKSTLGLESLVVGGVPGDYLKLFLGTHTKLNQSTDNPDLQLPITDKRITMIAGSDYDQTTGATNIPSFHLADGTNASNTIENHFSKEAQKGLHKLVFDAWKKNANDIWQAMQPPQLDEKTFNYDVTPGESANLYYADPDPLRVTYGTAAFKSGKITLVMKRIGNKVVAKEITINAVVEDIYDFDFTRPIGWQSHKASIVQIGRELPGRAGGRLFHSEVEVNVTYTSSTTYPERPQPIQFFNEHGYIEDGQVKTPTGGGGVGGPGGEGN